MAEEAEAKPFDRTGKSIHEQLDYLFQHTHKGKTNPSDPDEEDEESDARDDSKSDNGNSLEL